MTSTQEKIIEPKPDPLGLARQPGIVSQACNMMGCTMIAFGGDAPLHAGRLCEKLDVDRALVPPAITCKVFSTGERAAGPVAVVEDENKIIMPASRDAIRQPYGCIDVIATQSRLCEQSLDMFRRGWNSHHECRICSAAQRPKRTYNEDLFRRARDPRPLQRRGDRDSAGRAG